MIVGTIGIVIIMIVIFMFKKTDDKVNEYKIKRNPNDISTLEKVAVKNIERGDYYKGIEQLERIRKEQPHNVKANLLLATVYYKMKNFESAEPIIKHSIKNILIDNRPQVLRFEDDLEFLIASTYYFYGHMAHKKGNFGKAEFYKKESRIYDKKVADTQQYY